MCHPWCWRPGPFLGVSRGSVRQHPYPGALEVAGGNRTAWASGCQAGAGKAAAGCGRPRGSGATRCVSSVCQLLAAFPRVSYTSGSFPEPYKHAPSPGFRQGGRTRDTLLSQPGQPGRRGRGGCVRLLTGPDLPASSCGRPCSACSQCRLSCHIPGLLLLFFPEYPSHWNGEDRFYLYPCC